MLLFACFILVIFGIIIDSPEPIAGASIIYFLLFPVIEFKKHGIQSLSPVSLYSLVKGIGALGNLVGLLTAHIPEWRDVFFLYVAEEHLIFAMSLHFLGSLFVIHGFKLAMSKAKKLPDLNYTLSENQMSFGLPTIALTIFILNYPNLLPSLGTINGLVKLFPVAAIFFFARYGAFHNKPKYIRLAFVFLILTTINALLFSFLRMHIVMPSVAFTLGMIVGNRSLTILKKPIFYPIYIGLFIFISYFAFLGSQRSKIGSGYNRITNIEQAAEELQELQQDQDDETTFLARFSSINQLSQIGRVVEEDGFYYGETISYFVFGFIPRFLWPDKPKIQQGAWFAFRIGKGRIVDGKYINSIDMTPPGELYMNFGWIGVILGGLFHGFFFGSFWKTTNFWAQENNIIGSVFGFYLLFLGLFSFGADLQVIISLTAMYLLFWGINKLIGNNLYPVRN